MFFAFLKAFFKINFFLFKFDILAAFPCCESRLVCNNCSKPIVDVEGSKLKNFSSFSQEIQCPHCHVVDTHFLKPFKKMFTKADCETNLEWSLKNLPQEQNSTFWRFFRAKKKLPKNSNFVKRLKIFASFFNTVFFLQFHL